MTKEKVTKTGVTMRLRIIRDEPDSDEERDTLTRFMGLMEEESKASKAVNDSKSALDNKVLARYQTLTEEEIKTLVVHDKWFGTIHASILEVVKRLTQQLTDRIKDLDERYARPLPELEREVEEYSAKVESHLKKMRISL